MPQVLELCGIVKIIWDKAHGFRKDLISWGVFQNEKLIAIGSLCLFTRIPYMENLSGTEGYILNIYTSPKYRKCGFANQILDAIIEYSQKNV